MRLLLDTNAVLAVLGDAPALSSGVEDLLNDDGNERIVSVASFWEMTIKSSLGKLRMARSAAVIIEEFGQQAIATILPISAAHLWRPSLLPRHHRDPFDRLIVTQALNEDCSLVSSDTALDVYGVARLW